MKLKLLFAMFIASVGVYAQPTTHMITWKMGVAAADATKTINSGDSVMWMWGDASTHTVTSDTGAAEAFDSGTLSGATAEYTHKFTKVGVYGYACQFHPMMKGTITVTATAGVKQVNKLQLRVYPNPVTDFITIDGAVTIDNVAMYDITGKQIFTAAAATPIVKVYMDNYSAGTYIVKVTADGKTQSMSVVKK